MFGAELLIEGNDFMTACFRPLVTSFTGKYGSIQYFVKAVLERPAVPDRVCRQSSRSSAISMSARQLSW